MEVDKSKSKKGGLFRCGIDPIDNGPDGGYFIVRFNCELGRQLGKRKADRYSRIGAADG